MEIIGDFSKFKEEIRDLSGQSGKSSNDAIAELVRKGLLSLQVDFAYAPDLKKNFFGEY